jgi:hypothetical protein
VITGGLTVLGNALIQGADNKMDKGAALTLNEGLANPPSAPVATYGYEKWAYDSSADTLLAGFGWDTATSKFYTLNNFADVHSKLVEAQVSGSAAQVLRTHDLSDITDKSWVVGVGIIGTDVWVGYVSPTSKLKAAKYDLATLTLQTTVVLINSAIDSSGGPAFGTDGTNLIYANWSGTASGSLVQIRTFNTSGTQLSNNTTTGGHAYGSDALPFTIVGIAKDGTDYWIEHVAYNSSGTILGTYIEQYNAGTFAHVANKDTYIKKAVIPVSSGIAWDGTNMRSAAGFEASGTLISMYRLGALLWNDASGDIWYLAYEWADGTPHVTLPSPMANVSAANTGAYTVPMRRGRITITNPTLPSGVTAARIYADHASSPPASTALNRQSATTYIDTETGTTHVMKDFDSGGAAPDLTNTFPGGTSNILAVGGSIDAPWNLGGNGKFRLPTIAVAQRLASPQTGDSEYGSDLGGLEFYSTVGTGQWAPVASRAAIAKKSFEYHTDFLGGVSALGEITSISSNGGTVTEIDGEANHPGIVHLATGTTLNATGTAGLRTYVSPILLGSGVVRAACLMRAGVISTVNYAYRFGVANTNMASEATIGFNFRWSANQNAGKFQRAIAGTNVDTGITLVTATWYLLEIVINSAGTAAEFFINGASVGTSSGAAQTGAALLLATAITKIDSSATSRVADIDMMYVAGEMSAARY